MSLEDDIRVISGVSLFEDLSDEQLRLLAFGAERLAYSKGQEVYREGQAADCGYVVVSGAVDLFRPTMRGRRILKRVEPGAVLGELALIANTTRLTGAVAAEDSQLVRINRSIFRRMLEEYPHCAAALHARLTERLQEFLHHLGKVEPLFLDK